MKKAFTLIELLVVVLIIGILSAVALPQYRKAVMKTKVLMMIPVMSAIDQAQKEYFLANGTYATSFEDLSIQLPSNFTSDFVWGADQNQCHFATASSVQCQTQGVKTAVTLEKYYGEASYICWPNGSSLGKTTCQNLAGTNEEATVCTSGGCTGYRFSP